MIWRISLLSEIGGHNNLEHISDGMSDEDAVFTPKRP